MRNILQIMAEKQKKNEAFTFVAYGDSVTNGCFLPGEIDFKAVWHARLADMLTDMFPNLRINRINSGINGISTVDSVARLERDAIAYKPDLVIVCLGLNDVAGDGVSFYAALRAILTGLRDAGIPTIYLVPCMVASDVPREEVLAVFKNEDTADYGMLLQKLMNDGTVDRLFTEGARVAKECGAVVCDGYGAWKNLAAAGADTSRLLINRINHPTKAMHEIFAALLVRTILMEE